MNKITYNGRTYGKRSVINSIKREFDLSENVSDFYANANLWCRQLAEEAGTDAVTAIGIVAALSPLKSWENNKQLAQRVLLEKIYTGHTKLQMGKAVQILSSSGPSEIESILHGEKTTNFFRNILFYKSKTDVTIDRHAVNLALNGLVYTGLGVSAYQFFKMCYVIAAEEVNVTPLSLQATVWTSWRARNGRKRRL